MTAAHPDLLDWLFARPGQDGPAFVDERFPSLAAWLEAGESMADLDAGLIGLLRGHEDPVIRSAAALALGMRGSASAGAALIAALDDEPLVAMEAAAALASVGGSDAVESLCAALRNASANVRANAAAALVRIGGTRAIECLATVRDDPDSMVRRAAADVDGQERGG